MKINKGTKLYNQAKKLIPGGTQLLSKRPEMFLPERWPSYYKKSKGVEVWDLDGNKYIDCLASIGSSILGFADPDVNRAVIKAVNEGNTTTLNSPEEVELAKVLTKLHPWSDMARFARSGGEAMSVAVRIARSSSGKDKIAFCGYHGWSDWYLASNIAQKKNLDGHLLPGLAPKGVPRGLRNTAFPFEYNRIEQLKSIVKKHKIGVIVMEPIRFDEPKDNFLSKVRTIANSIGAVLVFDEITIGWRLTVGGAHLKYGVNPDIAVFAKGISNGYPMSAIIGRRKVMQAAQETFISSSSWTERIGFAASLASIKKMKDKNVPAHLNKIGKYLISNLEKIAHESKLDIELQGLPPLFIFSFKYGKLNHALNNLYTQEMLKRGFITSRGIDLCYAFKMNHAEKYLKANKEVFELLTRAIRENKVNRLLSGPLSHQGFRRLT
jgi:glutamate-1-semialdehyde 2,1-aminomutase